MAVTKKTIKKRVLKIWHIFHFGKRFELPDDFRSCRRSPLMFTKDFVGGGSDDESISFQLQMAIIDGHKDRLMLRGAFGVLKTLAANRSRCYRGYLLDEKMGPASERRISQWLGLEPTATRKVLKILEDAGLIERIDVPKWDLTVNDVPNKDPNGKKKATQKPGTAARTAVTKPKTRGNRSPRAAAENSGDDRKPLRGKKKKEENRKTTENEIEKNKKTNNQGSTASPPDKAGPKGPPGPMASQPESVYVQPNLKLHKYHNNTADPNQTQQSQAEATDSLATQCTETSRPTGPTESDTGHDQPLDDVEPNTESICTSTESDAGAGLSESTSMVTDEPPRSAQHNAQHPYDVRYDQTCKLFAVEIYEAIRCSHPPDSKQCRQELGCFAAAWDKARQAGLSANAMQELWTKSVKEAKVLGAKPAAKFMKSKEAVWRGTFNKRLHARVAEKNNGHKASAM